MRLADEFDDRDGGGVTGRPMGRTWGRSRNAHAGPSRVDAGSAADAATGPPGSIRTTGSGRPRTRPRGRVFAAALVAVGSLLTACSPETQSGEQKPSATPDARPPATTPEEAARILKAYAEAMTSPDAASIRAVEASTARTVHTAQLRLGEVTASVAAEFAIPRFASYPRWFAAGAVQPGMTGDVAIFVQSRKGAPWRVHRLVYLSRPMPELSRDAEGYVTVAEPGDVPARLAKAFARGVSGVDENTEDDDPTAPIIGGLRANIKLFTTSLWQVEHATSVQGRSYALKTKDGGSVVWYVVDYTFTASNGRGRFEIALADEAARMLRDPVVSRSFAWTALYQTVAHAPAGADDRVLGVTLPGWTDMRGA